MHVQVSVDTREILAYGFFPSGSPDKDSIYIMELLESEVHKLYHLGTKILDENGIIVVTPPNPDHLPEARNLKTPVIEKGIDNIQAIKTNTKVEQNLKDAILETLHSLKEVLR